MERICKKAQKSVGIPVLTMLYVCTYKRGKKASDGTCQTVNLFLLEPRKKKSTSVNLLGHFAPLEDGCELYDLLKQLGVKTIREISRCENYEEYLDMAEANLILC